MIAQSYITEWSEKAPWSTNIQVEQDLIICRALCSIYQDELLAQHLAFRGGTCGAYRPQRPGLPGAGDGLPVQPRAHGFCAGHVPHRG